MLGTLLLTSFLFVQSSTTFAQYQDSPQCLAAKDKVNKRLHDVGEYDCMLADQMITACSLGNADQDTQARQSWSRNCKDTSGMRAPSGGNSAAITGAEKSTRKSGPSLNYCVHFIAPTASDGYAYIENRCRQDANVNYCYLPRQGGLAPDESCIQGAGQGGPVKQGQRLQIFGDRKNAGIVMFACPSDLNVDVGHGPGQTAGFVITRGTRSRCGI